ncbi:MAG: hypothetical protein GY783_05595 [Gammaproteobacteria bacterium]|jgi:hypothetical protein|nr:hypothetical protein [Gammaproteobacteria bacterium]MDP7268055.1 hypothetical protein [Pirellulales bacterium]HJN66621.1 hypothetical protein [Pirellulales bacterium]
MQRFSTNLVSICFVATGFLVAVGCSGRVQPPGKNIQLASNTTWTSEGIQIQAGQTVTIRASGSYRFDSLGNECGPEGIAEAAPHTGKWPVSALTGLALIGRIGKDGTPFFIGRKITKRAESSGMLYLAVNDDIVSENTGSLMVNIQID